MSRATSSSRSLAVASPSFSISRTSRSSGSSTERLAVDLEISIRPSRASARRGHRRRQRASAACAGLHLAAELLAEHAEVGPHLVGDEIAAPLGEEDLLDVELVEDEPADPLELRPHVDPEDLRGEDEGRRSERLAGLEVVRRRAPRARGRRCASRGAMAADERARLRSPSSPGRRRLGPVSRDERSRAPSGADCARGARAASRRGTA